jgi:RHS repeat-associated protein
MRESGELFYLLGDHLGSTSLTLDASGNKVAEQRYKPYGSTRYEWGTAQTKYQYTGQRKVELGIYYYQARFYDASLGQFLSPDTIIPSPGNVLDWNRYLYSRANPLRYIDPSGHCNVDPNDEYQDYDCIQLAKDISELYGGGYEKYIEWDYEQLVIEYETYQHNKDKNLDLISEPDAVGLRIEGSGWVLGPGGVDVNLDFVYFTKSDEFSIFITPGYQEGVGGGGALTGGILFFDDMPNKNAYSGPAATIIGADVPLVLISVETDHSIGLPNPDGTIPNTTYIGIGPIQPEVGGYVVGGYTFDLLWFFP